MDAMRPSREPTVSSSRRSSCRRTAPCGLPIVERSQVPRVVVQVASAPPDAPVREMLAAEGFDLVACQDGRALLEEVMHRLPDAVIYALGPDCGEDLGVLRLLRRAAPDVPLVLLAAEDSLDTRRSAQPLRPIYFAVGPVDGTELRDVVHAAIRRRGRAV